MRLTFRRQALADERDAAGDVEHRVDVEQAFAERHRAGGRQRRRRVDRVLDRTTGLFGSLAGENRGAGVNRLGSGRKISAFRGPHRDFGVVGDRERVVVRRLGRQVGDDVAERGRRALGDLRRRAEIVRARAAGEIDPVKPGEVPLLSLNTLQKTIPSIEWGKGSSGVLLSSDVVDALSDLWNEG